MPVLGSSTYQTASFNGCISGGYEKGSMIDHRNLKAIYKCNFGRFSQLSVKKCSLACHAMSPWCRTSPQGFDDRQEGRTLRERARAKKKQYNRRGSLFRGVAGKVGGCWRFPRQVAIPIIPGVHIIDYSHHNASIMHQESMMHHDADIQY